MFTRFQKLVVGTPCVALALLLATSAPALADSWTTTATGIVYTAGGSKVGVGTSVASGPQLEVQNGTNFQRPAILVNQAASTTQIVADFQRSGTSKLKVDSSGLVGVANSSPTAQLDVLNSGSRTSVLVNQTATTTQLVADFQRNGSSKLKIDSLGQVGIGLGTTAPTQALHVAGNGYLTGFLQADGGLRVKTWSMEVPDYVFDQSRFKLTSLDDLDRFIQRERHLPEMPSAADLQENGMDVADMNLRLLKRVEELTLYVIAQDKQIRQLSKKITHRPKDAARQAVASASNPLPAAR